MSGVDSPSGGRDRRRARPRRRPARGRHGPVARSATRGCRSGSRASAASASTGATSTRASRRRPRSATRGPATSSRSCARAHASRRSWSRTRAGAAPCRSCSAATTRSRWARSAGWRRCTAPGGVLWIDAHGDLNRPRPRRAATSTACRSPPRSASRATRSRATPGRRRRSSGPRSSGVRSLDAAERELIGELEGEGVHDERHRPPRARARGARVARVPARARRSCTSASTSTRSTRCSRPASARRFRGGLSYREAHLALELVAESEPLDSLELVEVNPILDRAERDGRPRRRAGRERSRRADPLSREEWGAARHETRARAQPEDGGQRRHDWHWSRQSPDCS